MEIIGQERNRNFGVRLNISSVREGDGGLYNCSASSEINGQRFTDTYTVELQILRTCVHGLVHSSHGYIASL